MNISRHISSNVPDVTLADYLNGEMQSRGVNQVDLSRKTGLSQGYVSSLLSGKKKNPSEKVLRLIAGALELDLEKLFRLAGITYKSTPVRSVLVGVAGASASGKSWFARKMKAKYGNLVSVVCVDGYYKTDEVVRLLKYKNDDPESLKLDDVLADMVKLKSGADAIIPKYDYEKSAVTSWVTISPTPIIIFEGHLLFNGERIRNELDLKIWMEASNETRLKRRVLRDHDERKFELDDIMERYFSDVVPAYYAHIAPNRSFADIAVVNDIECAEGKIPLAVDMVVRYIQSLPFYGESPTLNSR